MTEMREGNVDSNASQLKSETVTSGPSARTSVQPPLLGILTEICIVTPDFRMTIDGLAHFGVGPFQVFHLNGETCRDLKFRSGPGDFDIIACFAKQGGMAVEIMQPFSGQSLMQEYLDRNGDKPGLQHVAWGMGDGMNTEQRIQVMADRNIEVGMQGTWIGKKGTCKFTFFDTEQLVGTVFETIEFSDDWEDPPCEWYPHAPSS